ncbi:MAG TPA: hypothetical protein VMJ32_04345 [Pirellulales bacterium]|nr:hypothetical protein [Pirellulales bacterium]
MMAGIEKADPASTKYRRWRLWFGLRTLLIAVTVVGVLLAAGTVWYHAQENEYVRQQAIAQRLESCGAQVTWEQHRPACLGWIGSPSTFKRVATVVGGNLDCVLNELPDLPDVREVVTSNNQLTREDLDRLAKLDQITKVTIGYGQRPTPSENAAEEISPDEIDARLSQKIVVKLP